MVVLVAHVDGIKGVVLGYHLVERNHFPGVAITAGCVFKSVRQTDGAQRELLIEDSAHLLQVVFTCRYIVGSDHRFAHVAVADQAGIVDTDLIFRQALVKAVNVAPGRTAVTGTILAALPGFIGVDERTVATIAADLAGDPLIDTAVPLGRVEQVGVSVRMDVDEARRYDEPFRIHKSRSVGSQVFADRSDLPVPDGDVALDRVLAVPGMDDTVLDDGVERILGLYLASRHAGQAEGCSPEYGSLEEVSSVHGIIVFLNCLSGRSSSVRPGHRPAGLRGRGGWPGAHVPAPRR